MSPTGQWPEKAGRSVLPGGKRTGLGGRKRIWFGLSTEDRTEAGEKKYDNALQVMI